MTGAAAERTAAATAPLRAEAANLPRRPGVYRFYDAEGELIYVGKAVRLRDRVQSYFAGRPLAPKVAAMVRRAARLEVTIVGSETEALLLECNLIKAHRPRYNIVLRDDKTYPYIVCPAGHPFPRLVYWRGPRRPAGRAFGPFPNAGAAKEVLQHLQKVFRVRGCRDAFFAHRSRPCLQYQIGRCTAPCVGYIDEAAYGADVAAAVRVLEGRSAEVEEELQRRMEAAAAAREFEAAAALRDQIAGLKEIQSRQIANAPRPRDLDAVAIVGEPGRYALSILTVREGLVLGTEAEVVTSLADPADTLAAFLVLHYGRRSCPAEIALNAEVGDLAAVAAALATGGSAAPRVFRPDRGLALGWIGLAAENARESLRRHGAGAAGWDEAVAPLIPRLDLPGPPARIECFDISHTGGEGTVASCVVFGPEGPEKRHYRRFNIENIAAGDDYAALRQALQRHGRRIADGEFPRPDLVLIDGGAAQVEAAAAGLREAGLRVAGPADGSAASSEEGAPAPVPLLGISKGPARRAGQERLHQSGVPGDFALPPDSPTLHLLQRIRDEAHRFAISGHRRRRARRFSASILESIAGLGRVRRRALLTHFGGLQGVLRAGLADLERTPGIGPALARTIYDHLHPGD